MKEPEWLVCDNPSRMKRLKRVQELFTQRKLRLFMCACCRATWEVLTDERSRRAVEVSERYADGKATRNQLAKASEAAYRASEDALTLAEKTYNDYPAHAAQEAWFCAGEQLKYPPSAVARRTEQCNVLRDIIGNPFRPMPVIDPSWLTAHDSRVKSLAQVIYDERRHEDLPILADALEEAGCDDAEILQHCRGSAPHFHGCWALDLVLERE